MSFCSIGGYSFVTKAGADPAPPAMIVDEITRDGIDSQAYRQIAKRGQKVSWVTEADTNTPSTLFSAYQALQGTLVTVIADDGGSFANVMVLAVERIRVKKVLSSAGGITGGGYILTARWTMQGT
jgi:hypothetical protein